MRPTILALFLVGCAAVEPPFSEPAPLVEAPNGRVGTHGMVAFGSPAAAFLSHIPMFRAPHDVQLVVSGRFEGASLPASFSHQLFTFLPERISLDELRTGALHEFSGTLFFGNFEAGGRPLPGKVRFAVGRVIEQHVLDEKEAQPKLTYLVMGTRADAFAVHRIAGAPSFDEILAVRVGIRGPSDAELATGIAIELPAADTATNRLGLTDSHADGPAIEVAAEVSCLDGPGFDRACASGGGGER